MNVDYKKYDSQNMFGNIYNFPDQMRDAMQIGANLKLQQYSNIKNIVFVGMGGSAIAGDIVCLMCQQAATIPMIVTRTYEVPAWVDEHSLVICLSYSGNTEETLSAFHDANSKNAHIMGITSGGQLAIELQKQGYDIITIPGGLPPRASLGYLAVPLLYVMRHLGLLENSFAHDLDNAVFLLQQERELWSQADERNEAFNIAKKIYQSYPLIYGEAERTSIIARRWRGQLAENSKMLSGSHELPELNHNEIVGFHKNPELLKDFGVIWLIDPTMSPRLQKRLSITQEIINPLVSYQITVEAQGPTFIAHMFYLIYLGDWVSFWCAILHHENPTPVDRITALKELLAKK